MDASEIVIHVVNCDRVFVVFDFLREAVCQACKPPHSHPHREILALNIARGNVAEVRVAADYRLASAHADSGAVAHFRAFWRRTINLVQHRVINLCAECILHGVQIGPVAVRSQLHAMRQTRFEIVNEVIRATGMALADEPTGNQFRIRIERDPRPYVASALLLCALRCSFSLSRR